MVADHWRGPCHCPEADAGEEMPQDGDKSWRFPMGDEFWLSLSDHQEFTPIDITLINSCSLDTHILQHITKHISPTEEEARYFVSLFIEKKVRRRDCLLQEGQPCRAISYVCSGALRAYCLGEGGKEATIMFAVKDWWVTDMFCFVNKRPAMMFIEAIEDSTVLQLQKEDLDELLVRMPVFERFFRILMQNAYIREQLRVIQNLSMPAQDRYDRFLEKYPQIAQQVTQKQIASYLGITPEFLSKIRQTKRGAK
jgi:CRP-like cAMP-binding protein